MAILTACGEGTNLSTPPTPLTASMTKTLAQQTQDDVVTQGFNATITGLQKMVETLTDANTKNLGEIARLQDEVKAWKKIAEATQPGTTAIPADVQKQIAVLETRIAVLQKNGDSVPIDLFREVLDKLPIASAVPTSTSPFGDDDFFHPTLPIPTPSPTPSQSPTEASPPTVVSSTSPVTEGASQLSWSKGYKYVRITTNTLTQTFDLNWKYPESVAEITLRGVSDIYTGVNIRDMMMVVEEGYSSATPKLTLLNGSHPVTLAEDAESRGVYRIAQDLIIPTDTPVVLRAYFSPNPELKEDSWMPSSFKLSVYMTPVERYQDSTYQHGEKNVSSFTVIPLTPSPSPSPSA